MAEKQTLRCVVDPGIVELADGLKILSDPNRLRILCLLLRGERCVCEVERELNISQQLASHHLNVLREAGFLESRRAGTSSYYAVVAERLEGILDMMRRFLGGGLEDRPGVERSCFGASLLTRGEMGGPGRVRTRASEGPKRTKSAERSRG
ncbi:metalloregulator ArsR/SmtB family transcription factor [Candidatus Solincola tengchongensis]|uniref:ArsR/SmtB family transcription factor n=1 Tax=Candidatus Solincola tengchongensis TaxID=2900693 RepID=UPI00257C69B6|nr:metalloregulator ArsR/SmtB family transcription factor [Candidatus Solincola tengchongensis]